MHGQFRGAHAGRRIHARLSEITVPKAQERQRTRRQRRILYRWPLVRRIFAAGPFRDNSDRRVEVRSQLLEWQHAYLLDSEELDIETDELVVCETVDAERKLRDVAVKHLLERTVTTEVDVMAVDR